MNKDELLKPFITYLQAQKGLSPKSVTAYTKDVSMFLDFLENENLELNNLERQICVLFLPNATTED